MMLDWEPLALLRLPVESAGSGCRTLPPGYILAWGLEKKVAPHQTKWVFFQVQNRGQLSC